MAASLILSKCLSRTDRVPVALRKYFVLSPLWVGGAGICLFILLMRTLGLGTWRDLPKRVIFQSCQGLSLNFDPTVSFVSSLIASYHQFLIFLNKSFTQIPSSGFQILLLCRRENVFPSPI